MQERLFRNGGKRRGAGRKPAGPRAGMAHVARPTVKRSQALHITLRALPGIPALRQSMMYAAIRAASVAAARQQAFRIVHLSIQRDHLHLIVEADDKGALARGMQSFQISAARRINALIEPTPRRGRVFADRYHLVVIRSPTQMRHVLAYVLGNWRKHHADRGFPRAWLVDPYATGFAFEGWKETGAVLWPAITAANVIVVKAARSWVLAKGWRLGGEISVYDVPGKRPD